MSIPTTASLPNGYAVTVGLVNQLAVPPNPGRQALLLWNNSGGGQIISICPASLTPIASGATPAIPNASFQPTGVVGTAAQGVAATNGAGSITLQPGQSIQLSDLSCSGAWNCVSNIAGGALTVLES